MISKKYIKDLGFKTIEDLFNYIIESEINGAYLQVTELINKLSNEQFKMFCDWFNNEQYQNNTEKEISFFINKRGCL